MARTGTVQAEEPKTSRQASLIESVVRRLYTHLEPNHTLYTPLTDPRFVCPYYPVLQDAPITEHLRDDVGAAPDILVKRPKTDDIHIYVFTHGDSVSPLAERLRDGASHRGKRVVVSLPAYTHRAERAVREATDRPTPPEWFASVADEHGGTRWSSADGGDIPVKIQRTIRSYYSDECDGVRRQRYVFHKPSRYYA